MNIVCVDQFSQIGGGQSCLLDLVPAFLNKGWSLEVVLPGDGPFAARLRTLHIPTHFINSKTYSNARKPAREIVRYLFQLFPFAYKLIQLCSRQKTELLYVNGPRFLPAASLAAWWLSIPLVFHCHHRMIQRSAVRLTAQALRLSRSQVIACCRYTAQPLQESLRGNIRVLYNGISGLPPSRSKPRHPIKQVGVIGRIESEKGQLEFVTAVRTIAARFPECSFSIIGAPLFSNLDYLKRVIHAARGLPIRFTGWQDDIAAVFSNLDLLVVPSPRYDATPRVILEAFSADVPVVACPAGGIPELIEDKRTGFLAPDASSDALAQTIAKVLTMADSQISSIVARAQAEWRDRFNLSLFQEGVCSVLADVALREHASKQKSSNAACPTIAEHSWQALKSKTLLGDRRNS